MWIYKQVRHLKEVSLHFFFLMSLFNLLYMLTKDTIWYGYWQFLFWASKIFHISGIWRTLVLNWIILYSELSYTPNRESRNKCVRVCILYISCLWKVHMLSWLQLHCRHPISSHFKEGEVLSSYSPFHWRSMSVKMSLLKNSLQYLWKEGGWSSHFKSILSDIFECSQKV